jgi:hypothetical protein
MAQNSLSLKVAEAYTRDVGRGVARIDCDSMDTLNASTGDTIEIKGNGIMLTLNLSSDNVIENKGKGRTVSVILPLYPSDEGQGIIRIDGLVRFNSGTEIGDTISIKKIKTVDAKKVVVAPLEAILPIDERHLVDALENVRLIKGDNVMVPYFGGRLTFQVIEVTPDTDAVLITQKTVFHIAERITSTEEEAPAKKEESVMTVQAYCEPCRTKTDIKNPKEVKLQNGRPAVKGSCSVCGTNVFHMGPMPKERTTPKVETPATDDPLNILKLRLEKGEITIEEYDEIKEILE